MPKKKSVKRDEPKYIINVHPIDPTKPGSFKLSEEALILWDKSQRLGEIMEQAQNIASVMEKEQNEERKKVMAKEVTSLVRDVRAVGLEIIRDSKEVLKKFITIEGDVPWEIVYDELSLEDVRKIINSVIDDPFVFMHMLITSEGNTNEEE